jgi:hypothetical protein
MLQLRGTGGGGADHQFHHLSSKVSVASGSPVIAGVARQGVAMVTVNSPARRVSTVEKDESSSGSDDKVI